MMHIHALDTAARIRLSGERAGAFTAALGSLWARCLVPEGTAGEEQVIGWDTDRDHLAAELHSELTRQVTLTLIQAQAGKLLMLHAGAVCHPGTGEAIAYVAPGGTGKTTLTRLLATRMGYLTDETVGLRTDGSIAAYPKPLSVRIGAHRKQEHGPDELGLLPAHPHPRLRRLALLRRDGGPVRVERLSLTEAILALAPETSSLDRLHLPLHRLAGIYDEVGGILRYSYGEARDLAEHVWKEFGC